ncbi:MAG: rhamnulokinase family protein [Planctomycetaceae bacterium]
MARQCYLAVDLGAESGRVLAGHFDGRTVELQELHRFPNTPVSVAGTLRWNVMSLWSEILTGLSTARAACDAPITSVGVDTWGVDYALLSASGELLGQPYHYRDPRTQGMLNHTLTQVPKSELFAQTGVQFMEINTLYQLVATLHNQPELLETARTFLMMPDLFHWLLCGSRVVEFTNATTSQCFDPTQTDWSRGLLSRLGLPLDMFPDVVDPGTRLGPLRPDVARQTGLDALQVVAPATHDTGAAVAAIPTRNTGQANWAYISSGTWSLMGLEVNAPNLSPRALQLNVTNEGGIDGTYRLLKNIMGLWIVQECRRALARRGRNRDYAELTRLAAEAPPFLAWVDPDHSAFLSPQDMPEAIRTWCRDSGQAVPETEGQIVRCALESLALKYRLVLTWLEELSSVPVEVIHIVGGGTQNTLLNQLTADACRRTVITGPIEATGLGNVLLQARAAGEVASLSEMRDIVRAGADIRVFEPRDSASWSAAIERFDALLAARSC